MNNYTWTILFAFINILLCFFNIVSSITMVVGILTYIALSILKTLVDIHDELKLRHVS